MGNHCNTKKKKGGRKESEKERTQIDPLTIFSEELEGVEVTQNGLELVVETKTKYPLLYFTKNKPQIDDFFSDFRC